MNGIIISIIRVWRHFGIFTKPGNTVQPKTIGPETVTSKSVEFIF